MQEQQDGLQLLAEDGGVGLGDVVQRPAVVDAGDRQLVGPCCDGDGEGDGLVVLDGPGVKRGHVVSRPAELADVAPTICYLAETPVPADCEGGIISQALEEPDAKVLELQACRRNSERLRRSSGATPLI